MHLCTPKWPRKALSTGRFISRAVARAQAASAGPDSNASTEPTAVYVHLPFCKRRCYYCDFPIQVVGNRVDGASTQNRFQDYVDVLSREISATARLNAGPLATVFFGGGTPSLLPPTLLEKILCQLQNQYGIDASAEISMEADPGTFDAQRLREYKAAGVTRFSIGVQAFDQALLALCGRAHSLDEVYRAVDAVHAAGVTNWSLDLISGLPQLTILQWAHGLKEAVSLQPQHISVYDLQVEEKTPFSRWYTPGTAPLPSTEDATHMYREASKQLRAAGYVHYEVSNYALPGYQCRHNMTYWQGKPYYAFGLGASSYLMGRRFTRSRRLSDYTQWVNEYAQNAVGYPAHDAPLESPEDRLLETVMLRLRLASGLDLTALRREFGSGAAEGVVQALQAHAGNGLAVFEGGLEEAGGAQVVRLTDPEGFLVSNTVISDVFSCVS